MTNQQLPLSIQTFEKLRENQRYVYVDKTSYLHQLVQPEYGVYFFSRPRRFGKSLTLTTLESIFLGKKELFKGLAIADTDYEWTHHPVIRLDMKMATHTSMDRMIESLKIRFRDITETSNIQITENLIEDQFYGLIRKLHQKTGQKTVVLIDEYDKPLINQLERFQLDAEAAHANQATRDIQAFLKSFYGVLKSADEHLRFVFITGVSKFSKVSIFSDLNHLNDISMDQRYAAMCGYTQEELETSFSPWIESLAQKESVSREKILNKIKTWYNGYRMTEGSVYVYNPWSTLFLFDKQSFQDYWFETGTPSFLIKMMKKTAFDLSQLQDPIRSNAFSTYDIENLAILPLLFQTGFLTIKTYDSGRDRYMLDFPNREVNQAFSQLLFTELTETKLPQTSHIQNALWDALEDDDLNAFFDVINTVYANIPSYLHQKAEGYYHSIFIAACQMAGVPVEAEQSSSLGRSDAVLKSHTTIYVVEFKLNGTADDAIAQIHKKKYMDKYRYTGMPIVPVGVGFDYATRQITSVKIG